VALDYMAVMSRHPEKKIEAPLTFLPTQLIQQKWRVPVEMSATVARLQCISGIRFWVFESGKDPERHMTNQWHLLTTTFDANPKAPSVSFKAEDHIVLTRALGKGAIAVQAFCEVLLKQPKVGKDDWSKDLDCTDPWVFPLEVGVFWTVFKGGNVDYGPTGRSTWFFRRPAQERGEVPDWKFLAQYYSNAGYIPPVEAITGKPQKGSHAA